MLYFKFKDHAERPVEDDCLKTSDFTEHFPSDLSHVDTWYVEYEDEDKEYEEGYASCEIGLYDDGGYAVMAPHEDFYGFWIDSDLTIEGFQRQHGFQMITKDEFDKVLNGCVKAMSETSIYEAVNDFLADWNPIGGGIPEDMAKIEYTSYVSGIVNALDDWYRLTSRLYSLLESTGMSNYYTEKDVNDIAIRLRRLKFLHKSPDVYVRFNDEKMTERELYTQERPDDVASWYVHYDYKQRRVLRDVGFGRSGEVVTSASYTYSLSKWLYKFPLNECLDGFTMSLITKDQFEKAYDSANGKEKDACTLSEVKQDDTCASVESAPETTCEPSQEQDVVEKKKMPFWLSVIRAFVLLVLICFVLYFLYVGAGGK